MQDVVILIHQKNPSLGGTLARNNKNDKQKSRQESLENEWKSSKKLALKGRYDMKQAESHL